MVEQRPDGRTSISETELNTDQVITTIMEGEPLFTGKSDFQEVTICNNKWWGTCLFLDNVLNVATRDEFIYHEMICNMPMMIHPNPQRVLIIGGGDGGSARECMKHQPLEKLVMIDIDGVVVKECEKHMPSLSAGAFTDPRMELIIGDGIDYVMKAADKSFDVIIVDSTDPIPDSCGEVLFTDEFYQNCNRIMSDNGVIITQSVMPMRYDSTIYNNAIKTLQNAFTKDRTYVCLVPTESYNGCTSFGLCFKGDSHPTKIDKARIDTFEQANKLKYYNYKIHHASLSLPNYLKDTLNLREKAEEKK